MFMIVIVIVLPSCSFFLFFVTDTVDGTDTVNDTDAVNGIWY